MPLAKRVVVTGIGLVTPIGVGTKTAWNALLRGDNGMSALSSAYKGLPCRVAAFVPDSNKTENQDAFFVSLQKRRDISRSTVFALLAAKEALQDANWPPEGCKESLDETGVAVGIGIADLEDIHNTGQLLDAKSYNKISPYFVPRILTNMASGHISIQYGFSGPNHSVSTACTTGLHAIGDAATFIAQGKANVMVCGGTEACISPISVAGFCRLRALSTKFNSTPEIASRPFDKDRDGFVIGEGAGILVLEELGHALQRNANIYAEILGYGLSGDAYHLTSPSPDGRGALLCMERALQNADVPHEEVGYVNAHATSTPLGDKIEVHAIQQLLGKSPKTVLISSTKGSIGHLLGAAGAVEAIFACLACNTALIPPTINFTESDIDFRNVSIVTTTKPWQAKNRIALKNSFGFGGTNGSICIRNYLS